MAQFRGSIEGQRGPASRLGSKKSGLRVTCNGWDCGIEVLADNEDGGDIFRVFLTSGSSPKGTRILVGEYTRADLEASKQA